MTSTYPDILAVRDRDRTRCSCTVNGGTSIPPIPITNATVRICEALGREFGRYPGIIGWQTDNEFWSIAQNDSAMTAFRTWLKQRYGTLEQLNETWSTTFWSQQYFDWSDIQPPLDYPNPGLYLDWHRFHSQLTADFQRLQIDALKPYCDERQWITHNFHPFDDFDRSVISEDLDIVSWDAYVTGETLRLDPAANGLDCDRLRGIKRRNIWIMETLPGFVNWRPVKATRSWRNARHGLAHGRPRRRCHPLPVALADQPGAVPRGMLQQDGEPRPVYHEIARFGAEPNRPHPCSRAASRPTTSPSSTAGATGKCSRSSHITRTTIHANASSAGTAHGSRPASASTCSNAWKRHSMATACCSHRTCICSLMTRPRCCAHGSRPVAIWCSDRAAR